MQICTQDTYRNVLYERLHKHVEIKTQSLPNIIHTKYYTNKQYLLNYERVCYKRFQLVIFISTRLIDSLQHPNS